MANRGAVGVRPPEIPRWAFKALGGFIVVMLLLMLATMTATLRNDAHASSALASAAAPNSRSVGPPERDTAGARAAVEVQPVGLTTPNGAPTSTNAPLAASPLAVSRGGLPFTAADSAKLQVVTPPRRATFGAEQQASADRAPTPVGGALDEVLLTDGRKLRGRVELIRAGTVQFHEVTSGLRYEFSKKEIVQVTTEFGNVVKFDGSEAATPNVGVLLRRGVGGSYRVRYAVNKVSGTSECGTLWKDGMPPDDRVVVRHVPGADTLQFGFVRGATFNAVIDVGARFSSTFVILPDQALTASALTSRISGAFSDSGFTGQVNLIGYRRSRPGSGLTDTACHSILDMSATLERPDH